VFVDGVVVKTHRRVERGRQTDYSDYPPEKVAFFMRTPAWCRRPACELGPHVAELIGQLLEINALHRLRSAKGSSGSPTATTSTVSTPPALVRSRSAIRAIAR